MCTGLFQIFKVDKKSNHLHISRKQKNFYISRPARYSNNFGLHCEWIMILKPVAVSGNSLKSVLLSYLSQSLQGDRSSHGLCVFLIGTWCLGLVVHTVHCDLERTKQRIMKQFQNLPRCHIYSWLCYFGLQHHITSIMTGFFFYWLFASSSWQREDPLLSNKIVLMAITSKPDGHSIQNINKFKIYHKPTEY